MRPWSQRSSPGGQHERRGRRARSGRRPAQRHRLDRILRLRRRPAAGFLGNRTTAGHALLVIAILMTLSAVIAGTTRRSPDNRTQSGPDTQERTAVR